MSAQTWISGALQPLLWWPTEVSGYDPGSWPRQLNTGDKCTPECTEFSNFHDFISGCQLKDKPPSKVFLDYCQLCFV